MASGTAGSKHAPTLGPLVSCVGFTHRQIYSRALDLHIHTSETSESVSFPLVPIKGLDSLSLAQLELYAHP